MPKTTPAPCGYGCGRVATVRIEETFDYPSELRCAVCVRDTSRQFEVLDRVAASEQLAEEREREIALVQEWGLSAEPREITDAEAAAAMRPSVTGERAWAELVERAAEPRESATATRGDVVSDRAETDPCERGTVGCPIRHVRDGSCETW